MAVHARDLPDDVPRQVVDHAPVRRVRDGGRDECAVSPSARGRSDGVVGGVRSADTDGIRLGPSHGRGRGRAGGRRDRQRGGFRAAVPRDTARPGLDVDDDQCHGGDSARDVHRRRRRTAGPAHPAARHAAERHPQGVHRARDVYLSARAIAAPCDRCLPLHLRRQHELQSHLDLRVSHAGGGGDGGAGVGVHVCERPGICAPCAIRGTQRQRFRAADLVLLRGLHRPVRGDRQVSRRPPAVGAAHEGAVQRQRRRRSAPVPYADGRRHAHGAAAPQQRGPRRHSGDGRRAWRHPVAAHEFLRRSVGASDRA